MNSKKKPLKILFIIDHLGAGGAQRQLTELVRKISKVDYQIEVISLSDDEQEYIAPLKEIGVPVTMIDHYGTWSWRTFLTMYKKFRVAKPDIVHTWLFTADMYGQLAAIFSGIPYTISAIRNTTADMPWHYRLVYKILSRRLSRITVNVETARRELVEQLGIPPAKIKTIYNGIELDQFLRTDRNGHYREEWKLPKDAKVVGMIARMSHQKDYLTFIESAKIVSDQLPNVYFVLVGDGPMRREIEQKIKTLGLESKVRILGNRTDAWAMIHSMDVCVLATHHEGCSNVIMEAMAAARPVVATDAGGNKELIIDKETGYLVAGKDARGMANAIIELLNNSEKAKQMGEAAQNRIKKHFTLDETVKNTEALYQEMLVSK